MSLKKYLINKRSDSNTRYKMFLSSGGIIKELIEAGVVGAWLSNKSDGSGPLTGNDSPWKELINNNDGDLTNFAGTVDSGWNTEGSQSFLTFDQVDDYLKILTGSSGDVLDITVAPLTICVLSKGVDIQYLLARNEDSGLGTEGQYGLFKPNNSRIDLYLDSDLKVGTIIDNTIWCHYMFHWDGVDIKTRVDFVLDATTPFVGTLPSLPNLFLGARSSSIDGSTATGFTKGNIATMTIYTGSDEQKIIDVEQKIAADYLALNP